jgi:hypothetical protein
LNHILTFRKFDFVPARNFIKKKPPRLRRRPGARFGSTAAPAVVRRALAVNSSREPKAFTMVWSACIAVADDEGVVGCARGGRAPQTNGLLHFLHHQHFDGFAARHKFELLIFCGFVFG